MRAVQRKVVDAPSSNFGARRGTSKPSMVVLHYTGMETVEAALERLRDPASEVSAHYLIGIDGQRWALVDEECRAWHAGVSSWGVETDINSQSIGIELVNTGHELGYSPFPEAQMMALEALLARIFARWHISPERVIGHACVAPGRKRDPGEKFDWRRLAASGFAVWPSASDLTEADGSGDALEFQTAASTFGYGVPLSNVWDGPTLAVLEAMRGRFRPQCIGQVPNASDVLLIKRLAQKWPVAALAS